MKRVLPMLAGGLLLCTLAGCRDAGGPDPVVTPTPSPTPFPAPTPTQDLNPDFGNDDIDEDFDGDDLIPDDDPGGIPATGAAMVAMMETVTVIDGSEGAGNTLLSVQRSNGEVWSFDVTGDLVPPEGDFVVFESANLVFGDAGGALIYPILSGTRYPVDFALRIR